MTGISAVRRALYCVAAACLLAPNVASAQQMPGTGIGVTVQGRATIRRPADFVRFQFMLGQRQGGQPDATVAAGDALVAALKRAGIDDAAVSVPVNGFIGPQQIVSVAGTLRKPTPARIRSVVAEVTATMRPDAAPIQNAVFFAGLDDCSDVEQAGIAAAVADARSRASLIAAAAGVRLGAIVQVGNVFALPSPPCPTKPDRSFAQNGPGMQLDSLATTSVDVVVPVSLTVTFGLR